MTATFFSFPAFYANFKLIRFTDSVVSNKSSCYNFSPRKELLFFSKSDSSKPRKLDRVFFPKIIMVAFETNISFINVGLRQCPVSKIFVISSCQFLTGVVTALSFYNNVSKSDFSSLYTICKAFSWRRPILFLRPLIK